MDECRLPLRVSGDDAQPEHEYRRDSWRFSALNVGRWDPIAYALGFIDCDNISARAMLTIFQVLPHN